MFNSQIQVSIGVEYWPKFAAILNFNDDDNIDIVLANGDTESFYLLLVFGNGTFENPRILFIGARDKPTSLSVGALNNNNNLDTIINVQ